MRPLLLCLCAALSSSSLSAQPAAVSGQVVLRDSSEPLGYTTIAVLSQGRQLLSGANGRFLIAVPAGEVRLRFKRIGFAPRDTTLRLASGDTAQLRIDMARLVIQLPEMLVSGRCDNETPREPVPGFLGQLIDQIVQNSERMTLLAAQRPFQIRVEAIEGLADHSNVLVPARTDTALRSGLPARPYKPREVMFLIKEGPHRGAYGINLLELPDIADTAFTNNHCFRYAGRAKVGDDSVVQIQFEPVPWLDREYDLTGTLYLKVDGYQMVGSFTRLNHLRPEAVRAGYTEYFVEARFKEIVPGVPVLDWMQLTNRMKANRPAVAVRSRVIGVEWKDSTVSPQPPTH